MQELLLVGLDHLTAPVEVRGRFAFTDTQKIEFTSRLLDAGAEEVVILSTCNRSMVCLAGPEPESLLPRALELYLEFFDGGDWRSCVTMFRGRQAVEELYRITCGLRSVVLGEDQILGQVREAQEFAARLGSAGKILNKIFREAITLAKQVKTQLGISRIPLSVSYIGIKLLEETMGGLKGKNVLLVGLGKMNRLSMKYLTEAGVGRVWLCTRTRCKATELAEEYAGCEPLDFYDRYAVLPEADAVITATASPHTIFAPEQMPALRKPLHVLDIAVPRDTEPALAELPGVSVYVVDDLRKLSSDNLARRQALAAEAEELICHRAEETMDWLAAVRVDPTIQSLNQRCSHIAEDTVEYLCGKLALSEKERKLVDKMVHSALERLMREPVLRLRQAKSEGQQKEYIRLVEELFDL